MRYRLLDGPAFQEALQAPRKPWVLDLRKPAAFAAGHVPGARNIPVHDLPKSRRMLPPTLVERMLLIADTPKRAEAGANFLALMGYADLAILVGGLDAYPGELESTLED